MRQLGVSNILKTVVPQRLTTGLQNRVPRVQVLLPLPCQKALKALCFQGFLLFLGVSQIRPKTAKYGIKVCQKCVRKKEGFPSFFTDFILCFCLFFTGFERAGLCACLCRDGKGPRRALSPWHPAPVIVNCLGIRRCTQVVEGSALEIYFRCCSRKFSKPLYFKHLGGFTKVHISVCSILFFYPAPDLVFWEILR